MSKRAHRHGGKFGGDHTSFIGIACIVADIAVSCEFVTNVASGLINTSRKKKGSRKHVKIIDTEWGILLCVTDGSAHQEIRIYASSVHHAKLSIARGARNANLTISFGRLCP